MANLLSDRFTADLGRCVQQLRQQTEDQRAQQGWPGPDPQRPLPQQIIRFRLLEDLYGCGTASAQRIVANDAGEDEVADVVLVQDRDNAVGASLLARPPGTAEYVPAGTCGKAAMFAKIGWVVLSFDACCAESGSGSGSGPGGAPIAAECGVPCPPPGCRMQWVEIEINGKLCRVLVCCPAETGSGSGGGG